MLHEYKPTDEVPGVPLLRCVYCGDCVIGENLGYKQCEKTKAAKQQMKTQVDRLIAASVYAKIAEESPQNKSFSPIHRRIISYVKEVARWKLAGSPVRSDNEVLRLYDTYCASQENPCKYFRQATKDEQKKKRKGRCRLCGCKINISTHGLLNKLRMATTSCPADPPRFVAEVVAAIPD